MKSSLLLFLFSFVCMASQGQEQSSSEKEKKKADKAAHPYDRPVFQRPLSIGLGIGTTGIGLEAKLALHKRWNVRLGTSIMPLSYTGNILFQDIKAKTDVKANFNKVQLLAEFKPFNSWFRVVGGLGYYYKGELDVTQQSDGTYKIGNTTVTGEEVGSISFTGDWKGIAPYLGIGLCNDMPKKRLNVSIDLGTYYLAAPKAEITGTKLLEDNASNQAQLEENLKSDRWLPVLQFNLNYKLQ